VWSTPLTGFWGGALNSGVGNLTNQGLNLMNEEEWSTASFGLAVAGGGVFGGVMGATAVYGSEVMPVTTSVISGFGTGFTAGLLQGAGSNVPP
jgi:hypothetical protein